MIITISTLKQAYRLYLQNKITVSFTFEAYGTTLAHNSNDNSLTIYGPTSLFNHKINHNYNFTMPWDRPPNQTLSPKMPFHNARTSDQLNYNHGTTNCTTTASPSPLSTADTIQHHSAERCEERQHFTSNHAAANHCITEAWKSIGVRLRWDS